jgi:hypothetical protein
MHTSTSPQYAIIASCDVAAAMMEPPGGKALVEESIMEALDFRRAMRKVDAEFGKDWWFKVWGPSASPPRASATARTGCCARTSAGTASATSPRLQHARSDQGDRDHPGAGRRPAFRRARHSGLDRHQVPGRARHHRREDRALLVLHHVHHRHHQGPLEHDGDRAAAVQGRLRQQPAAVARAAGVLRNKHPRTRTIGPARPVRADPRRLQGERRRAPDHRDVPVGHAAGDEAGRRLRAHGAPRDRPGRRSTSSRAASPACC